MGLLTFKSTLQNTKLIISEIFSFFSVKITFTDAKPESVVLKLASVLDVQNKYTGGVPL